MSGFPNEAHFRKLEKMYHAAPCNAYYAPTLKVAEGKTELILPLRPEFFHAAGAVHGSVYFKAMDDAAFFAANSLASVFVVTANFTVYFTRPIASGEMRARGRVVHQSKTQLIAEAVVHDDRGRQVGRGSGSFVKTNIQLTEEMGYR